MNVRIFDTTLRDGEQSPGAALAPEQRLRIALALDAAGVDVIEAGFPAASPTTAASVAEIAAAVTGAGVCAFGRLHLSDIDAACDAVAGARDPQVMVCAPTSDDHIALKLRIGKDEVLERIEALVRHTRSRVPTVLFAAEDATRSDRAFLLDALLAAVRGGATNIVVPDTVGWMQPGEFGDLIRYVREHLPDHVRVSAHCHDDFGLATANTLEAIRCGADEVQVTINGIGERAGNCASEEITMALRLRPDYYGRTCRFKTEHIAALSALVADATNMPVAKNKAMVGRNAFLHESGMHQDGVLKKRSLYEAIPAELVGRTPAGLALGRNSGRKGLRSRCEQLGITLSDDQLNRAYDAFVSDERYARDIDDEQVRALAASVLAPVAVAVR